MQSTVVHYSRVDNTASLWINLLDTANIPRERRHVDGIINLYLGKLLLRAYILRIEINTKLMLNRYAPKSTTVNW